MSALAGGSAPGVRGRGPFPGHPAVPLGLAASSGGLGGSGPCPVLGAPVTASEPEAGFLVRAKVRSESGGLVLSSYRFGTRSEAAAKARSLVQAPGTVWVSVVPPGYPVLDPEDQ